LKDAGGNAIFTSNGSGVLSGVNSGFGSAQVLISTETVGSAVATIDFTSGITTTYKEYIFEFHGIKSASSDPHFEFQVNASGQSGFNEAMTTTVFRAYNSEAGSPQLGYSTGQDQVDADKVYQPIARNVTSLADETCVGELHIFNPGSTTGVKNFFSEASNNGAYVMQTFTAGYINVTAAITQVSFKMTSGNIAAGTIKMYGIK
ncbi:uncharacterized protein METZ01_LOCUS299479, partial [marine metagenome]